MVPFASVIYVKSVHQTRFGCLREKFRFNRFGKVLWANPRWYAGFFRRQIECVVVRDSCTCGLLFCSMRFLLFAEMPSYYGALWHHGNHDKVPESVDNNEFFERDNPLSHFWGSCNKRLDECAAFLKAISIRTPAYTHQGNDMPLIDSLREECLCFF